MYACNRQFLHYIYALEHDSQTMYVMCVIYAMYACFHRTMTWSWSFWYHISPLLNVFGRDDHFAICRMAEFDDAHMEESSRSSKRNVWRCPGWSPDQLWCYRENHISHRPLTGTVCTCFWICGIYVIWMQGNWLFCFCRVFISWEATDTNTRWLTISQKKS